MVDNRGSTQCPRSPTEAHHWMIAGQDGATSEGTCRYCGAVKNFYNSVNIRPMANSKTKVRVKEIN